MAKHGKKYKAAAAKVNIDELYGPKEAMKLVRETSITKFDSTVEVHIRTGLDPRQADQQVRDVVVLPHGLGKTVRVLVFAAGDGAAAARAAGADLVADDDETLKRIEGGMLDFDVAIATPDMMGKVGRLGRILGPRGLMPNPKAGTVVGPNDLGRAILECWPRGIPPRQDG
jgi:large subunit ribosomal protein L1